MRPAFRARRRPTVVLGVLALGAGVSLAACDVNPPQSNEHASIEGTSGEVGQVLIRNVQVSQTGTGGLDVQAYFYNNATVSDTLTSVTSSVTSGGRFVPGPAATQSTPTSILLPAQAPTSIGPYGDDDVELSPLTRAVLVGQEVSVTFTFTAAGTITLTAPVTDGSAGGTEPPEPPASAISPGSPTAGGAFSTPPVSTPPAAPEATPTTAPGAAVPPSGVDGSPAT